MVAPAVSEEEFIALCHQMQSPSRVAKHLGINVRNVLSRITRLEGKGVRFMVDDPRSKRQVLENAPARTSMQIDNGVVVIGSDAHYMPEVESVAQAAFLKLIKEIKPRVVVMNGDAFDGGTISRWPRTGWEQRPSVLNELEACRYHLGRIEDAAKRAALVWPLGNHDARFNTRLAAVAGEFEGVPGFSLKDHFPAWTPCWSLWLNERVVVKHRFRSGIHATHNNTLWAGTTMVTGHTHSLKVTPITDYNGTRYGVDSGTLADPMGEPFVNYSEDNPKNHRSGFVVLTFHKGVLLPPELCEVTPLGAVFRGVIV